MKETEIVYFTIPEEMLQCEEVPEIPTKEVLQGENGGNIAGEFILNQDNALRDCHSVVEAVRKRVKEFKARMKAGAVVHDQEKGN